MVSLKVRGRNIVHYFGKKEKKRDSYSIYAFHKTGCLTQKISDSYVSWLTSRKVEAQRVKGGACGVGDLRRIERS